jgi:hypothetical protein
VYTGYRSIFTDFIVVGLLFQRNAAILQPLLYFNGDRNYTTGVVPLCEFCVCVLGLWRLTSVSNETDGIA